jgi:electron transport complex protein RnfC
MITEYRQLLDPKLVYIPLTDPTYKLANVSVEEGDTVQVGQVLAYKFKGRDKTPVIATVSGTVNGFEERRDRFNKLVDHVIIENDKEYNTIPLPALGENPAPAIIRERLVQAGINHITVDGNFTAISFDQPIKHILINAIYTNEPFISTDYEFVKVHAEDIADGIVLLKQAALADSATLIVDKYMDEETLDALGKATVDKSIEVVQINTKQVKGWDYDIARKIIKEPLSQNLLNQGVIYTSACAAHKVHDAVRNGQYVTKRQIAVTGDAFALNALYDIRIGTPFTEVVTDIGGYDEAEELTCHIGHFLSGVQVEDDSFVLTETIDTIHVSALRNQVEDICIKCGECNDICPAGILPQNIMDAELRNVNSRIVDLHTDECIECGLCSYVCPSKINVLEWVRRAKRRVG